MTGLAQIIAAGQSPAFIERLPSYDDVCAEKSRRRLFDFFRLSWSELETQELILNWHLEVIADHVQAVLEDWIKGQENSKYQARMRDLLINVPPGSSKSRIVSVCAPAWMWLQRPSWRVLCLSSTPDVARRDALFSRNLILSDWYQRLFEPDWSIRADQSAKSNFWNTEGGWRISQGWFAKVTGGRHDCINSDDPHDAEEVKSDVKRIAVISRWDTAIVNRVSSVRSPHITIGQRTHHEDISQHLLEKGNVTHLCIPAEFEPERLSDTPDLEEQEYPRETPIGFTDPRTEQGELLDPVRLSEEVLEEARIDLASYGYAGQMQQRPAPRSGGIWKRFYWGYWVPAGLDLAPVRERMADGSNFLCRQTVLPAMSAWEWSAQSWDMTFGGGETSSMVVGQVWALADVRRFLLDQTRGQLDFLQTQTALRALTGHWPNVKLKLIENKANGPAIISALKDEIEGIKAIEPEGDKVARAQAEEGTVEVGRVFLPHPGLFTLAPAQMEWLLAAHPVVHGIALRGREALREEIERAAHKRAKSKPKIWVEAFVDESARFPNGGFKDVVDTASQALSRMRTFVNVRDKNQEVGEGSTSWKSLR